MKAQRPDDLIAKYHNGSISQEEMALLNEWLNADEATVEIPVPEDRVCENILNSLNRKISYSRKGNRLRLFGKVAASLTILIAAGISVYHYRDDIRDTLDPVVYQEQQAAAGHALKFSMADGTVVWLNSMSKIRYPRRFNRDTREVYLDGEAFLEVAENKVKPFIVHASKIDVRVLGTSFGVSDYQNNEQVTVTLQTGKVEILGRKPRADEGDGKVLTRLSSDEQFVLQRHTQVFAVKDVHAADYSTWRKGKLLFKDATFREIVNALERYYSITVKADDTNFGGCFFTAAFEKMSVDQAFEILRLVTNSSFKRDGRVITIEGGGCK